MYFKKTTSMNLLIMEKEFVKGQLYSKEEIEQGGLVLFKNLSAVLVYKKDKLIYWFDKNDKQGKFELKLFYEN